MNPRDARLSGSKTHKNNLGTVEREALSSLNKRNYCGHFQFDNAVIPHRRSDVQNAFHGKESETRRKVANSSSVML